MENIDFDFEPNVIEAFSQGDCWVLAKELHRISGYKMYWAGSKHGDQFFSWCHIFVMDDSQKIIDINGIHDVNDFTNKWRRISKKWNNIARSSDFIVRPVLNIDIMTNTMRPKYEESIQVHRYAQEIMQKMNCHS